MDAQIVSFTLAAGLLTMTPGPDTMLVVRNVLRGGRRDGVTTTFGICTGLFLHATLSALGMSVLLMRSAAAFEILKIAGAGYLVYLGAQSLVNAARDRHGRPHQTEPRPKEVTSVRRCLFEGFFSNVLNPKAAVFYLAFLPQFIGPTDPVLRKSLLLATIHYAEGMVWLVLVSVAVGRMRQIFLRSIVRRWLDGVCGALFVGFGVRLAFARR